MDAAWTSDFPAEGRFQRVVVKEKTHWYFDYRMVLAENLGAMSVLQKMLRSCAASRHIRGRRTIFSHGGGW